MQIIRVLCVFKYSFVVFEKGFSFFCKFIDFTNVLVNRF